MRSGGRLAQTGPLWLIHLQEFSRASVQPGLEESPAQRKPVVFDPSFLLHGPFSSHYLSIFFPQFLKVIEDENNGKMKSTIHFPFCFLPRKKGRGGKTFRFWCVLNKTRKKGQDIRPHMAATNPEQEAPCAESHRWSFWYGEKSNFTKRPVFDDAFKLISLSHRFWLSALRQRERGWKPKSRPPSLKILSGTMKNC